MFVDLPPEFIGVHVDEDAARRLADVVRGYRHNDITILDVSNKIDFHPDRGEYLVSILVLSDPLPGQRTWPGEDIRHVRRQVRAEAVKLGFTWDTLHIRVTDMPPLRPGGHAAAEIS
jgi:hypothetical protein